jgi:hypothetical protein
MDMMIVPLPTSGERLGLASRVVGREVTMKKLLLALALLAFGLGPALAQDSPSDQNAGGGNDPPKQTGGGGGGGNKAQPGQEGNSGN